MSRNIESEKLTVVITGGGTGGHIYPAVAVAQVLKTDPDIEKIVYIGCPDNMEKDLALNEGLEFLGVNISGMPRKAGLSIIKWFFELNRAVNQSLKHLIKIRPDAVFGTGGYVSGPVLLAAIMLRIPFVIHDPDAHPGIVSRFIAPWARVVSVAFGDASKYLNSRNIVISGNPVRTAFKNISKKECFKALNLDTDKKTIIVMGGSQGAKSINRAMLECSKYLVEDMGFQLIHQTGKKNFDEYISELSKVWSEYEKNQNFIVKPYFDDMYTALSCADLAVSRAGSLSISELNILGLPAILVPYPHAAADHQRYNAKAMEKAGTALYLED
jgi:UDP-N-acetylglucosamine--N-acetylmuramyl-(pentapeptide) pyrophosphoryl-undecaprenol N-acetylglucosamine transferase